MRLLLLIFLLSSIIFSVSAQPCQGPGRTATSATAVCGTLTFSQKDLTTCTGQLIPNPTAGCGNIVTSDNAAWYKFHCYQTGTLGFLLTPLGVGDDFDWEIMDITGHDPNDVFLMELRVSLNLSGQTGPTGCTPAGTLNVHCAGGAAGTQFNAMPTITTGHDYILMVNNYSNTGLGYDITFSGSAVLNNNTPPTITSVGIVGCDASKIKVTFSEDILCSTISPLTGTEFSITTGTHPIAALVSDCNIGANGIPYITINLQTALTPGNYQLNIGTGIDGNTLENACTTEMLPTSIPFTVAAITPAAVNTITHTGCAPTVLDVKLDKPVLCNTITFSGSNSEFTIQPGNIPVTSVQGVCTGTNPIADLIHINLTNPLPFGNYQLVINAGPDGNTFIDTCGLQVVATTIPFTINQTTVAPAIQSVVFDECHPDKLVVNFDRPVMCSTISPAANEFSITPGALPISNVNYTCGGVGNYITQAVLTLQNPLPAGNFAVTIVPGTDGTTLADTCFAFMANGANKTFVTTKAPAPKFDSVQFDKCNPSFVKLFYSNAIRCSSVNANGSGYSITGPSAVNITGAVTDGNCGTLGYTKWVQLQFAQPVNVFGNYVVHNGGGITDTCSAVQNITETIAFNALVKPSAAFTSQVKFGCTTDTVILSHAGGNGINSWTWLFPDGSTATGQTVTKLFPVTTASLTIQLTVDNGSCSDVISQAVTLGNSFKAAFAITPKDTTCINTPVNFTNNSNGTNLQYVWLFGDNTQFAGQTPPAHTYTSNNTYNIKLVAMDTYGCADTAGTVLEVVAAATMDFTGLAPQYCSDKSMTLTKVASANILTYTWNDGDGMTVQDKPSVLFTYPNQGVYTITLTGTDKFCGSTVASKQVQIYAVPKLNLGNDTILCPATTLQIGPAAITGYTYLWSNGATTSQIMTDMTTASYSLQVDNNGCKASDAISVKVLTACLIMVPNAFTPNNDGNNDRLKPTNADLAKEFSFKVYNRYGQLIYATNNPAEGWDGTRKGVRSEAGTYVWQLSYVDPWNGKKVVQNGTSILLR
ncbi:PKD domain-containing protein [Ferruginibacter profundus]